MQITELSPSALWEHFHQLNLIPRPSKHEERALDYVASVGRSCGCQVQKDSVGNVIISCPATPGFENRVPVILQAHADMVPQKADDSSHDFLTDPIKTIVDDGWVKADRTTLGADNGIGVAAALAVLTDGSVEHGPLEVLITTDEETGMTGAYGLTPGMLKGQMLLNLDSESWGEVCIGGAGGVDVNASFHGSRVATADEDVALRVSLGGLRGGHSGIDINLGRANANKLLARFLKYAAANYESMLASISGGNMRNAIPRQAEAVLTIDSEDVEDFLEAVDEFEDMFRSEFHATEPNLFFSAERVEAPDTVFDEMTSDDLINALQACPNGPLKMSADVPGLVETSSNLAVVRSDGDSISVQFLVRSSVESEKADVASTLDSIFRLAGADVDVEGDYPGWRPNPQSQALALVRNSFLSLYGHQPEVAAIHAGLECGIMLGSYPNWDMVSFGPTIQFPHSPDERVNIQSVADFWALLVEVLKQVPSCAV